MMNAFPESVAIAERIKVTASIGDLTVFHQGSYKIKEGQPLKLTMDFGDMNILNLIIQIEEKVGGEIGYKYETIMRNPATVLFRFDRNFVSSSGVLTSDLYEVARTQDYATFLSFDIVPDPRNRLVSASLTMLVGKINV